MLKLARYEAGVCACGYHESIATDPTYHYTFETKVCPVCKGAAQFGRIQHDADEQFRKARGEKAPPGSPDPADGRRTMTRVMTPAEVAERRASSPQSKARPPHAL